MAPNHRDKTKEGGCGGHNLTQWVEGDNVENLSYEGKGLILWQTKESYNIILV